MGNLISQSREIVPDALNEMRDYFRTPLGDKAAADKGRRADRALKFLGRHNGMESTRVKDMSLAFQVAKHVGVRGEALKPLLGELSPAIASGAVTGNSRKALARAEVSAKPQLPAARQSRGGEKSNGRRAPLANTAGAR